MTQILSEGSPVPRKNLLYVCFKEVEDIEADVKANKLRTDWAHPQLGLRTKHGTFPTVGHDFADPKENERKFNKFQHILFLFEWTSQFMQYNIFHLQFILTEL